jgi:hypothetical protein
VSEYIIAKLRQVTGIVINNIIDIKPSIISPGLSKPAHIIKSVTVPDPTYTRVIKKDFLSALNVVGFINGFIYNK